MVSHIRENRLSIEVIQSMNVSYLGCKSSSILIHRSCNQTIDNNLSPNLYVICYIITVLDGVRVQNYAREEVDC